MAGIDSENDEDIDVISTSEDRRQFGFYNCSRDLNSFSNKSLSLHHFGNVVKQTGTQEFAGYQPNRRTSESESESSGESESSSSESESESEDEDETQLQPVQIQQHTNVGRLPVTPTSPAKKVKFDERNFWEENPDVYGIRRSGRQRKEPERYNIGLEGSESDDEEIKLPRKIKKLSGAKVKKRLQRVSSSDDWPAANTGTSTSGSSDEYTPEVRSRPRPLPRANARVVPSQAKISSTKEKTLTSKPSFRPTVIPKKKILESEESDDGGDDIEDDDEDDDDDDDSGARNSQRRAAVNVSYKEESDDETDSDDLVEPGTGADWQEYVEDDRECIEKILYSRLGRPGETGAITTVYAAEYEEMQKRGEPDPEKETTEMQYLIKWKGWSHLHNTWESEQTLLDQKVKGLKKLENFQKREQEIAIWQRYAAPEDVEYFMVQRQMNFDLYEEYRQVERIISHTNAKNYNELGNIVTSVDYLCKWKGLPYAECTWEDGTLISRFFQKLIDAYLKRGSSDKVPSRSCRVLRQRPKFAALKRQPSYLGRGDLHLRDYQLDGLNWLASCWCKEDSVILADEMGLGKTIQAISFLSYLFHTHSLYGPFLLVVPLSTMAAWQREFDAWGPDMNVIVYLGDQTSRNKIKEFEFYLSGSKLKFNALLTTYEIVLRDKAVLGAINWAVLIVDEAHRLKNNESQLYQALMEFHTNHRILITGTPLQNSMKELWSLLQFIMPDRFHSWEDFEKIHSSDEEKDKGFASLHKVLEPFLLRRVKKDVEKSLPSKVEQILRVDMSSAQKQYYKWILTKNYKALNKGMKGNANSFLNIVMELKKCCNHSQLIRPLDNNQAITDPLQNLIHGSGKLFLLDKLLCRLKETGHRVLIFSQMVRMLDILAEYLQRRRFLFQRLDGSIRGDIRKQALDHFNAEGSEDFCFLLSTRAGGLGINLATADTVIIFDSDWNPQNDLQAQARAHRIGQRNQVNIYRLVTKGSVEEDIIERAKRKMVLDHLVIQRMDTTGRKVLSKSNTAPSTTNPFNKEELSAILKFGAEELFKEGDEEHDNQLQAMDIDEILKRAETRDSDDQPQTLGQELLSQFKVASFSVAEEEEEVVTKPTESSAPIEKTWEDIIPETERKKLQEEDEQKRQLDLYLPPRQRNTVKKMNYGRTGSDSDEEGSRRRRGRKKKSDSDSDNDSENEGKENMKRKRGRPRTIKREDVEGFSDAEIRKFVKSFKKFGRPLTRLKAIGNDAELEDKTEEDLRRLADVLHNCCKEAVKNYNDKLMEDPNFDGKKRGATLRVGNVTINAPSVLKHEEELEPLAAVIPADEEQKLKYRLTIPTKSVHWGVSWDVFDDSMLLVGIHEYGMGSWEAIKADPKLCLASKILPPGNQKPQDKHLLTRAEYLIKILKQEAIQNKAEELRKSSQMIKSKIKKLKVKKEKKDKKKEPTDTVSQSNVTPQPPVVTDVSLTPQSTGATESNPPTELAEAPKGSPAPGNQAKKKAPKKPKAKKQKEANLVVPDLPETASPPATDENALEHKMQTISFAALSDMDKDTFDACKEKMRPVKRALKMLESPEEDMSEKDQVVQTRQCLLKIGDHVTSITSQYRDPDVAVEWRSNLWTFVSKFTAFEAKKLYKLYKHAAKKREETKHEETHKTKHDLSLSAIPQKKRAMEHTNQRSHDLSLKRSYDVTTSLPAPGGKIPLLENGAKSHSRDQSGSTHPVSSGHDSRSRPGHAERDRDRYGGQSKERNRDGHFQRDYRDSQRHDRPSHHGSDHFRFHDRTSEHARGHDRSSDHYSRQHDRDSDHHSRLFDKSYRRDESRWEREREREHVRERDRESRDHHSSEHRYHRGGASGTSPPDTQWSTGSRTYDSKKPRIDDKRSHDYDREKR